MRRQLMLLVFVFVLLSSSASAYMCAGAPTIEQGYNQSAAVFLGTVTAVVPDAQTGGIVSSFTFTNVAFTVQEVIKGDVGSTVTLRNPSASMSGYQFSLNQQYIVYAYQGRGLAASVCGRTTPYAASGLELIALREVKARLEAQKPECTLDEECKIVCVQAPCRYACENNKCVYPEPECRTDDECAGKIVCKKEPCDVVCKNYECVLAEPALPDLRPVSLTIEEAVLQNGGPGYEWNIIFENAGGDMADSFEAKLTTNPAIQLVSSGQDYRDETTFMMDQLPFKSGNKGGWYGKFGVRANGPIEFKFIIDPNNNIAESDETNQEISYTFNAIATIPEVVPEPPLIPLLLAAGDDTPSADIITLIDIYTRLASDYYNASGTVNRVPLNAAKLFSELINYDLDSFVTVAIYNGKVILIEGADVNLDLSDNVHQALVDLQIPYSLVRSADLTNSNLYNLFLPPVPSETILPVPNFNMEEPWTDDYCSIMYMYDSCDVTHAKYTNIENSNARIQVIVEEHNELVPEDLFLSMMKREDRPGYWRLIEDGFYAVFSHNYNIEPVDYGTVIWRSGTKVISVRVQYAAGLNALELIEQFLEVYGRAYPPEPMADKRITQIPKPCEVTRRGRDARGYTSNVLYKGNERGFQDRCLSDEGSDDMYTLLQGQCHEDMSIPGYVEEVACEFGCATGACLAGALPAWASIPVDVYVNPRRTPADKLDYFYLSVGNHDYVYKHFYILEEGVWVRYDFPNEPYKNSPWIKDRTEFESERSWPEGNNPILVYACNRKEGRWDCHDNKWMMYIVESKTPAADLKLQDVHFLVNGEKIPVENYWQIYDAELGSSVEFAGTIVHEGPFTEQEYQIKLYERFSEAGKNYRLEDEQMLNMIDSQYKYKLRIIDNSYVYDFTFRIDTSKLGMHDLNLHVDQFDEIWEINESNNGAWTKLSVIESLLPALPTLPGACPTDMVSCPDGSLVPRTGPNCEGVCPEPIPPEPVCPTDMVECLDGTLVPRTGPNCEWVCPEIPMPEPVPVN